jgi:hypothetical protein
MTDYVTSDVRSDITSNMLSDVTGYVANDIYRAQHCSRGAPVFERWSGQPHPVGEGQIRARFHPGTYILIFSNDPVFFQYKFTIVIQLNIYRLNVSTAAGGRKKNNLERGQVGIYLGPSS